MTKDCENCKMNTKKAQPVDYAVHEGIVWRMERANKRLVMIIVLLIVLLAASWIGFLYSMMEPAAIPGVVSAVSVYASPACL